MGAWPDTVYVAVRPEARFAELQRDLQAAFPAYPIYGRGSDFEFVPHITIAEGSAIEDPSTAADSALRALPRVGRADALEVIAARPDGRWRVVWRIRLGRSGGAPVGRMPA
jgi:2'-5' RNA ligase